MSEKGHYQLLILQHFLSKYFFDYMLRNSLTIPRYNFSFIEDSCTYVIYVCIECYVHFEGNIFICPKYIKIFSNTPSRMHDSMICVSPFEINTSSLPLSHIKKIDYKLNAVFLWTKYVFHFYLSFILGAAIDYMVRKIHTVDVYIVIYVCSLFIIYHFVNLIWYIFIIT